VAAETLVTTGLVVLAGEITTTAVVDYPMVARETIKRIGYDNTEFGIDYRGARSWPATTDRVRTSRRVSTKAVGWTLTRVPATRADVRLCLRQTPELMPAPIYYAHRLVERQADVRRDGRLRGCAGREVAGDAALCRWQAAFGRHGRSVHAARPDVEHKTLQEAVIELIVKPVLPREWLAHTRY